jgi:hypothetical protein
MDIPDYTDPSIPDYTDPTIPDMLPPGQYGKTVVQSGFEILIISKIAAIHLCNIGII